jgi:MFS family permease
LRLTPFLLPLICINITGHMALSGGRVTGSLYILKNGHPEALVGLFMALFSVVPVMTALSVGRWVDRAGAARVMRIGVVMVSVGAWLPVLYLSMPSLLLTGLVIGCGFNLLSMAAQHTVGHLDRNASPAERLANFGWYALGHSTSSVIGPLVAGLLIDAVSIRAAFAAMALTSFVAVYLVVTRTRGLPRPAMQQQLPPSPPQPPPLSIQPPSPAAEPRPINPAVLKKRGPAVLDLLATPEMRRIYWVNSLAASAWDLFIVMLPVLGYRLGFSASVIGTVFSFFALGTFSARAAMPWLSRRANEWQILRVALVVISLVYCVLPWMVLAPMLMAAGLVFGAAVGMSQPNILSLLHAASPAGRGGEAVGLRSVLSNGCSVLIPLAFGAALATVSISSVLLGSAVLFGAGIYPAHQGASALPRKHRA